MGVQGVESRHSGLLNGVSNLLRICYYEDAHQIDFMIKAEVMF